MLGNLINDLASKGYYISIYQDPIYEGGCIRVEMSFRKYRLKKTIITDIVKKSDMDGVIKANLKHMASEIDKMVLKDEKKSDRIQIVVYMYDHEDSRKLKKDIIKYLNSRKVYPECIGNKIIIKRIRILFFHGEILDMANVSPDYYVSDYIPASEFLKMAGYLKYSKQIFSKKQLFEIIGRNL